MLTPSAGHRLPVHRHFSTLPDSGFQTRVLVYMYFQHCPTYLSSQSGWHGTTECEHSKLTVATHHVDTFESCVLVQWRQNVNELIKYFAMMMEQTTKSWILRFRHGMEAQRRKPLYASCQAQNFTTEMSLCRKPTNSKFGCLIPRACSCAPRHNPHPATVHSSKPGRPYPQPFHPTLFPFTSLIPFKETRVKTYPLILVFGNSQFENSQKFIFCEFQTWDC